MKKIMCLIFVFVFAKIDFAQTALGIPADKTISLIFPFPIRHVDRGTKDVLVQQIREANNILLVKAATPEFHETNLTVVTEDGSVYTFLANFENNPATWVWRLPIQHEATLATYANDISDNPRTIHGISDKSWEIIAMVTGIYIKGDVIYYQIEFENRSAIDYDIELLRFYIRDKKKGKRTAIQENELKPLYISGNVSGVKAYVKNVIVVALEKFTIPDGKYLAVQIMEKNGGRHLLLKVQNRHILKAKVLPDL